jgi:hypothetical protein|tara:strand:+ start:2532 stop:2879 length:348 start_codon:yes stop_codon:yes gene_type:complete
MRTYANKSKKEKGTLANLTYTPEQEKEIIKIAGHIGLLMMERYAALASLTNPVLEDSVLAVMLDTSEQTIRKTRNKLTHAGWFLRTKFTKDGEPVIAYDIGKQAVNAKSVAKVSI